MIQLDEKYFVETDNWNNYSLFYWQTGKKGKSAGEKKKKYIGHFSSLGNAVKRYIETKFNDKTCDEVVSLKDAINTMNAISNEVLESLTVKGVSGRFDCMGRQDITNDRKTV